MFEDKKIWAAIDAVVRREESYTTREWRDKRIDSLERTLDALIKRLGLERRIEPAKPEQIVFVKAEKKED